MEEVVLICKGCGTAFPIPSGILEALDHDERDVCNRKTDREAEGWLLEDGYVRV